MRKTGSVSRTAKRTGSHKVRQVRRAGPLKPKSSRRSRKTTRRVTMFKSTSWYQTAALSIGISPRAAT